MTTALIALTRDQNLLFELQTQLEAGFVIVPCESLALLPMCFTAHPGAAVIVHLTTDTLGELSPGRFVAELDEAVVNSPVYGLVAADCPQRLQKLAEKAIDHCLMLPLDYDQFRRLLNNRQDLEGELAGFWSQMPHKELHGRSRSLITFTPEMFDTMEEIKVAARHNVTVLLIGETGSGKTFLARLIHELSERRDDRFCTVACGALPPDLIESELFGYVKGAFTGADRDREGKFAAAGRGTLLLDEIDVLPMEQQAKLLRVIETGEYEPVGSNETQYSQARLVVASNYNLEELVRNGSFRTDLYYRLNILNFNLLPLRHRPWDVEYLVRKFAIEHSRTHGIPLRSIEPSFLDAMRAYNWPGNIREMENVIRRAVLYCQRGMLTINDLPSPIRIAVQGHTSSLATHQAAMEMNSLHVSEDRLALNSNNIPTGMGVRPRMPSPTPQTHRPQVPLHMQQPMPSYAGSFATGQPTMESAPSLSPTMNPAMNPALSRVTSASLEARVDVLERRIIEDALQRNNFRRKETAAELGISRVTLYNKMKKFGLL
ncbi:Formate hydrogenlyase transcriptional activator [Anatilimnocola aggregata]|uniref:Formate hydrogenlyase transcriptional activator n=1 Tax=Anatilimnocola aggregata TaxID=2528021 RepID=A0A517Y781_9BACT|nr:sigma 54-interacting transcriptional regulator [Anatilimnocola aggregata]QDU26099.1 Formate hydrogenlyase transcriptional activator [Anatilimnocola aggregata]